MEDFEWGAVKSTRERQEFTTGSVRDSRIGKGRFDLLPPKAIRRLAVHFENGAVNYGERNWEKGQPIGRYMDSALRHLFCYLDGKSDEDHLAAVAWNVLCAMQTEMLKPELQDIPTRKDKPGKVELIEDDF